MIIPLIYIYFYISIYLIYNQGHFQGANGVVTHPPHNPSFF